MRFKDKIRQIAAKEAQAVANQIVDLKVREFDNNSSVNVGEVKSVNGTNLTVKSSDGTVQNVRMVGQRYSGSDSKVILLGGGLAI